NYHAYADEPAIGFAPGSVAARGTSALGVVTSVDQQRGVPAFVWASRSLLQSTVLPPGITPERAAVVYLNRLAPLYRLSKAALGTAFVKHVHDIGRGAIIVTLGQSVGGIDVFQADIKLVMNRQLELVAAAGNLHEMAVPSLKGSDTTYLFSPQMALAGAF